MKGLLFTVPREAAYTEIGSECYLMGNSHVAHDCKVGKRSVLANGAMLAGHVHMGEDVLSVEVLVYTNFRESEWGQ